jgi:hypothetical protein
MTAEKNPTQIDAVAARAPCREEKKVPTRPGSAEPVKMPVMFYERKLCQYLFHTAMVSWENSRR